MKLLDLVHGSEEILILTHHNADIDAVASCIVFYEFLDGKVDIAVPDSISKGAKSLAEGYDFLIEPPLEKYDLIIILDCPSKEQLNPLDIENSEAKKILIDHHSPGNLKDIADFSITDPEAGSTSEIIYQIFDQEKINEDCAKALVCGIVADTAHLKQADSNHFKYISKLLELSESTYSEILSILHTPIDFSERVAKIKAAARVEGYKLGKVLLVFSRIGSFEASVARSLLGMGADISIVFCPRGDEMRISARSRKNMTKKIHLANDLFKPLEEVIQGSAGGHDAAASSNGKNMDIKQIKKEMLSKIEKIFGTKAKPL
jgi:nanoRNase/pAp phosphatase (c-di-AMP/oligoRNAs hydrolase)